MMRVSFSLVDSATTHRYTNTGRQYLHLDSLNSHPSTRKLHFLDLLMPKPESTVSSQFLATIIGQNVNVKLHSGMLYQGRLESIDGFMNVALSSAKEHYESGTNGLLKTYPTDVFLRGTQVMYISEVK
ncbi:LSM6 (YDR378C) [Zygosaccharomyces parabailii]|nr:LSM6 (YDR378C) [Zygosaccharomyces parabailii]CDH16821.1 related to U6 snRNA-associated Sm-like protein LSm6 [Zygosaccharomyces bailii ISA1307]